MPDRTMKLTRAYLLHAGMVEHAVIYFRRWFPRGVEVDEEFARREIHHFPWAWMIQNLLEIESCEAAGKEQQEAHVQQQLAYGELEDWWHAGSRDHALIGAYNDRSAEIFNAYRLRVALAFVAGFTQQGGRLLLEEETR